MKTLFAVLLAVPVLAGEPVTIRISWDPVTTDAAGTTLLGEVGYRIFVATTEADLATAAVARETTATTEEMSLGCGPTYWIAISAFNAIGESPKSEAASVSLACPHHAPRAPGRPTVEIVPQAPPPAVALTEGFAGPGLSAGWEAIDDGGVAAPSSWVITAGQLHQAAAINDGGTQAETAAMAGGRLRFAGGAWGNVTVKARIMASGGSALGIVFRDSAAGYYRYVTSRTGRYRRIQRVTPAGVLTLAADTIETFPQGTWQAVEIQATGGIIVVRIDGTQILEGIDPDPLPAGTVGLYTWLNAYAYFDDLEVRG